MTKPVIYAGELEGEQIYTLSNGKTKTFIYDSTKGNRETFLANVGKEFALEIEAMGFYEKPETRNGEILMGNWSLPVKKVEIGSLERALALEMLHFSDREFRELKGDVK